MMLKNILFYYYHLTVEEIRKFNKYYYFRIQNQLYILLPFNRPIEDAKALYELSLVLMKQRSPFSNIILNKEGSALTYINQIPYMLIKNNWQSNRELLLTDLSNNIIVDVRQKTLATLIRSNWIELWKKKIDYFEYQITHFEQKYPLLRASLDYYIGLGENAISYIQQIMSQKKNEQDLMVISHRRINKGDHLFDFYNPLNIVIDHRVRDIAEYLKSAFFEDQYSLVDIEEFLDNQSLSPYGYHLFFARMLFPTFYFDYYEQIVNGQIKEEKILEIINRIEEYEEFLYDISQIIKKKIPLLEVEWLVRKKV